MNKKGFTLVELVVTVAVLSVLTLIALPSVRRIQASNRVKKYESYSQSIESAAKAYVDSYSEDLFDDRLDDDCATITYEDLKDKKLIKDIQIKGATCANPGDTKIQVKKLNNKYYYQVFLRCRDKNNTETILYESDYYAKSLKKCFATDSEDDTPAIIILHNDSKKKTSFVNKDDFTDENIPKVKIELKDEESGLSTSKNQKVKLIWTFSGVDNEGNTIEQNTKDTKEYEFIFKEEIIETSIYYKDSIEAPDIFKNRNLNGILTVYAVPINVVNRKNIQTTKDSNKIKFNIDSIPPELTVTLSKWKTLTDKPDRDTQGLEEYNNNTWIDGKVLTKADAKDPYPKNREDIAISGLDEESIRFTTTGATANLKNHKGDYRNIEAQGSSQIIYQVCDKAGNCTKSGKYKILLDRKAPTCKNSGGSATLVNSRTIYGTCNDTNDELDDKNDVSGCKEDKISKTYNTKDIDSTKESPGSVWDNAGHETKCDEDQRVKVDATPPTCTTKYTPSNYNGQWINKSSSTQLKVSITCSDTKSGCDSSNPRSYTFADSVLDSTVQTVSPGTIRDKVGNTTVCELPRKTTGNKDIIPVRIDKIAPTCTWDPKDTRDKYDENWLLHDAAAAVIVTTTCGDRGSGCVKQKYEKQLNYFFIELRRNDVDKNATAGKVKDNAGNETECPKVRPYSDSDCKYTDSMRRLYSSDSLRGNKYYIINTIGLRPNTLEQILKTVGQGAAIIGWLFGGAGYTALNAYTVGMETAKLYGYRRYRLENGQYKVCLDRSLDIMYEEEWDKVKADILSSSKKLTVVSSLKNKYNNKEWPGIEPITTGGD